MAYPQKLLNGRAFNARPKPGGTATEFHGKWVNYLDADDTWSPVSPALLSDSGRFEVATAPFRLNLPAFANEVAVFEVNNRADIFLKSSITASPLVVETTAIDAAPVAGVMADLDGDGLPESIVYPLAYPALGADLVWQMRWGRGPRARKLIRFNAPLATDVQIRFRRGYDASVEISPTVLADTTRPRLEQIWDGSGQLEHNRGYYVRLAGEAQKRGAGMGDFTIWDSSRNRDTFMPRRQRIRATLEREVSGTYILTKHIPASFFVGATFPCFTDVNDPFYPDPNVESTSVDGYIQNTGTVWATMHDAATGSSSNDSAADAMFMTEISAGTFDIRRAFLLFDASSLPDTDTIDAGTTLDLFLVQFGLDNGDNDGDDFGVVVQSSPASNTALATADFDACGAVTDPVEGTERKDLTGLTEQQDHTWTLNATGRGWVTTTGVTKLGIREGHDVINSEIAAGKNRYVFDTAEEAGLDNDPTLNVEHSAPAAGGHPAASRFGQVPYMRIGGGKITR